MRVLFILPIIITLENFINLQVEFRARNFQRLRTGIHIRNYSTGHGCDVYSLKDLNLKLTDRRMKEKEQERMS